MRREHGNSFGLLARSGRLYLFSALALGGGIAVMTMICGLLFQSLQGDAFCIMAVVMPALFLRPRVA